MNLEKDILRPWQKHQAELKNEISELIALFKYRHWLAHGRYWAPKLGHQRHRFQDVYDFVVALLAELPLAGGDSP